MPAVTRLNDLGSGHNSFPTHPSITDSPNVFVNGIGVVRIGDVYAIHSDGHNSHSGNLAQGSPNVFANGIAIGRIGDLISCGGFVLEGSPDVFCN